MIKRNSQTLKIYFYETLQRARTWKKLNKFGCLNLKGFFPRTIKQSQEDGDKVSTNL